VEKVGPVSRFDQVVGPLQIFKRGMFDIGRMNEISVVWIVSHLLCILVRRVNARNSSDEILFLTGS
jgi:hypothetical protein